VQAPQELAERREVAPAEHQAPIVLDLRDDLARCFLRTSAPLRETDELRAAIVRIVFSVLAPLARARGYKAINPEYLGPTGKAAAQSVVEASRAL
jgi:hypothetical protein